MQVARLYDFGDIRVEECARPEVGPDDLLVRVSACGICSGDIMPWYIRRKAPLVLGHEPVGVIEQAGAAVRDFRPGERVFVHHHAPCFSCSPCRRGEYVQCATWRSSKITPGGMAEYFVVSATNQRDRHRSIPPARFKPLAELPVDLYSLQVPTRPDQSYDFCDNIAAGIRHFDDTAAIVAQLDLVISVDTAVAHLAGALGKPVWILLNQHGEWRWLVGREDTPWYPTARLFRQAELDNWNPVLTRVYDELGALARQRG